MKRNRCIKKTKAKVSHFHALRTLGSIIKCSDLISSSSCSNFCC